MARPRRNLLSRRRIAECALQIVARNRDFTIPELARELNVHPSSLYHHARGGKSEIINLMREVLYERIDLARVDVGTLSWQERLNYWIRAYRDAMALPAALPILVGESVDDERTLRIYETLFGLLTEIGVRRDDQVAVAAMIDALVLGSAVDSASPTPLWIIGDHDLPHLARAIEHTDQAHRVERGLDMAVDAVTAHVERLLPHGPTSI